MKSADDWIRHQTGLQTCKTGATVWIKQVQQDAIQSCLAIVQHHNVNLMGGEAAKQSIIKALMTMVEGDK